MLFNKTEREKIRKLHDSLKDSDALAKLAYEFGQMANYFDRANSAHSREELGREDETKYKEFLRKGIQVKAQLQREIEGMEKGMKAGQEIGYFNSYDNKTLGLLSDAISRLNWTSINMRDNTGKKVAKELDDLCDKYKKLLIDGKRFDSKPKDSKVKDGGSFGTTFVEIDDVNQIDLSLIVKTIKDRLKQFGDILMEVTRGRLQKTDARQGLASIEFQLDVLEDNRSRRRYWSDITLAFRGNSKYIFKIYESGNKYEIEKFVQDIQKKLKQYEGKTIYKNNTIPDSKSKDSKIKDYSPLAQLLDEMSDLSWEIFYARQNYVVLQRQFNDLRTKIIGKKDPEEMTVLKSAVQKKQEYDRKAGFSK